MRVLAIVMLAVTAVAVTTASASAVVSMDADHCNSFHNCAACVASPFCGWCSSKVDYKSGAPGHHCAGFNKNATNPFICNGMYSTETCARGWQCSESKGFECEQTAAPGGGTSKTMCEANCSATGKTFTCDESTFTCKVAGPGHGTSFPVCNASCQKATPAPAHSSAPSSHHPASSHPASSHPSSPNPNVPPTPTPTLAPTFVCDTTTLTCKPATTPGHGASAQVCNQTCQKSNHTPVGLIGLWRQFPISFNGNVHGVVAEEDLEFLAGGRVKLANRNTTLDATATFIGADQVWFTPDVPSTPPTFKCLYKMDLPLPETEQMLLACSSTGTAPTSFHTAMSAVNQDVQLAAKCVNSAVNCTFNLGPKSGGGSGDDKTKQIIDSLLERSSASSLRLGGSSNSKKQQMAVVASPPTPPVSDPCEGYSANCSFCLSHLYCGWCSTNVIYNGGQTGKRCAGFNPNGGKNPFTCSGSYSTEECVKGYACDAATQMCTETSGGAGVPKKACDTSCKAHKGPPSELVGKWRGLFIQNGYTFGVVAIDMSNGDNVTISMPPHSGATPGPVVTATMKHIGGEVFLTYTSGPMNKSQIAGIFTIQYGELATYIDIAFGGANENAPTSYPAAMVAPNTQLLLAKCMDTGCTW